MPMPPFDMTPVALTIAGSDNSAGAGIQADLKTFSAHGCYGLTAVTCVVSEIPGRVAGIQAVRASLVASQIDILTGAFPIRAVKTGMLYSHSIVRAVAESLKNLHVPLVVDPVMVASSGDPLLKTDAVKACKTRLFPLATLLTPNLDELSFLSGEKISTLRGMEEAGRRLADGFGCAVLLKGGHLKGPKAVDLLISKQGIDRFEEAFIHGVSTHGTGCTYSAAITANLANGHSLRESVARAKDFITKAIKHSHQWPNVSALNLSGH
jgi:hydroxymethylpyrimidine/phosphomethylpyrimidine kinase